jgi:hypothetical protein
VSPPHSPLSTPHSYTTPIPRALLRTLLLSSLAYWLGGTLFYITAVIHTAHDVLGSQRDVGFVTREVTRHLNLIGVATLTLLLPNTLAALRRRIHSPPPTPRPPPPRAAAWLLLSTWLAMAALQGTLFALHPRIDRLLDPSAHRILDRHAFKPLHNAYMTLTTLLIAAGIGHAWAATSLWSRPNADNTDS